MKKPFEVVQLKVAHEMMRLGGKCIGCYLNHKDFIVYTFERGTETYALYHEARKNLGLE